MVGGLWCISKVNIINAHLLISASYKSLLYTGGVGGGGVLWGIVPILELI